ncbi:MAG: hypothetical protein CMJ11_06230 [Pelagibacterales bacterium]|nr:hypothetical protein [Pelagibacterales bacterium]|tara:strand:- start:2373 stop:3221 length:849 start_codon:yes stop_codon:yes gene_type:complete
MNNSCNLSLVSETYSRGLSKRIVKDIENISQGFIDSLLIEFKTLPFNPKSYSRKRKRLIKNYTKNTIINFNLYNDKILKNDDFFYWLGNTHYFKGMQPNDNNALGLSIYETSLKLENNINNIKSYGYIPKLNMTYHCLKRFFQRYEWNSRVEIYDVIKEIFIHSLYIIDMIKGFDDQIMVDENNKYKTLLIPYKNDLFLGDIKYVEFKDGITSKNLKSIYFDCRTFINFNQMKESQRNINTEFSKLISDFNLRSIEDNQLQISKYFDLVESHIQSKSFEYFC